MRHTNNFCYFLEKCFYLYKQKKLSTTLFETVLTLKFLHPYKYLVVKTKNDDRFRALLEQVCNEATLTLSLRATITKIISGELPDTAHVTDNKHETYRNPFYLKNIFQQIEEEHKNYSYDKEPPYNPDYIPYFLMILDHPCYYLYQGNSTLLQSHECLYAIEKYWAIFAMGQIGISYTEQYVYDSSTSVYNFYSDLIRSACSDYQYCTGPNMPIYLMEDVLHCRFPAPFKYPFFILDYKDKELQNALDEFIAIPTIPCGLKAMARKIKKGKLATRQEMADMEGYRKFRQTHFTLYETILPHKRMSGIK